MNKVKKYFKAIGCLSLLAVALGGCGPKLKLKAVKVARAAVETTITTTTSGTVEAEQQAILSFSASGRVAVVAVQAGEKVKAGQVLAHLENRDLQVIFQDAEKEMKRAQELFNASLVSRAALDDAKRNYEISRANLDKTIIRAPFEGVVTEANLEIGELAQLTPQGAAKPPMRIVDLKPRLVRGDIDEVDLSKIQTGMQARVKIPAVRVKPFPAAIDRVVPFISTLKEKDRTSEIRLKITEDGQLIPVGASADVEIIMAQKNDAIAVPSRVILGHGDARYVYRYEDGRIYKTPIKLGIGNYDKSEIVSGMQVGQIAVFPPEETELSDKLKVKIEETPWP